MKKFLLIVSAAALTFAVACKKEKKTAPEHTRESYSVAEFSDRTFLTARGVEEFLGQGRLQGFRDEEGNWRLGPENLQNPNIRHLIR